MLQPNIFSHVPLMVCCSLTRCSECGSAQPIIGGWTEHWVFQKSNVQFAKVVKQNVFLSATTKLDSWSNCTGLFVNVCVRIYYLFIQTLINVSSPSSRLWFILADIFAASTWMTERNTVRDERWPVVYIKYDIQTIVTEDVLKQYFLTL